MLDTIPPARLTQTLGVTCLLTKSAPINCSYTADGSRLARVMARRRAVPADVKKIVRARDKNVCRMCRKKYPPSFFDYDHIDAHIAGGSDDPDNIRLLCKDCNLKKGSKLHCDNCGTLNARNAPRCISCGIRDPNRGRPSNNAFLFGLSKRRLIGLLLILWIVASVFGLCGKYSLYTPPNQQPPPDGPRR